MDTCTNKSSFRFVLSVLSREEVEEKFGERINVVKFLITLNMFEYLFLQNFACEFDVQNHLLPFISELGQLDKDTEVNQIIIDLYFDKKQGMQL